VRRRPLLLVTLTAILLVLQYRLWFADGSLAEKHRLEAKLELLRAQNAELQARNQRFSAEILELREGSAAIEERARTDLGLIREGEVFYQFTDPGGRSAATVSPGVRPLPVPAREHN